LKENDSFYKTLNETDLKARRVKSVDEYINNIKHSVSEYNESQKQKLKECVLTANKKLEKINNKWFSGKDCAKLPWIFGCIKGKLYEDGLPHTIKDVIILSSENVDILNNNQLVDTIIHEKVHIYQKNDVNIINNYLSEYNIKRLKRREKMDKIRANPDIDEWLYEKDGVMYGAFYNSNEPFSITDVYMKGSQINEHPFEEMAIKITKIIKEG